jgi:hypothetical protein
VVALGVERFRDLRWEEETGTPYDFAAAGGWDAVEAGELSTLPQITSCPPDLLRRIQTTPRSSGKEFSMQAGGTS